MSIGIFYESIEWSNQHLGDLLNVAGVETELINLETAPIGRERIFKHKLIVNRLFPSAALRGYTRSFKVAGDVLKAVHDRGIAMINPYPAYAYDCSKMRAAQALSRVALPTPSCYACFSSPAQLPRNSVNYPCVLKPDCGGRSLFTYIINNQKELEAAVKEIPAVPFIIQKYCAPIRNYITRLEIIDDKIMSIMKRSVGSQGISGYHHGSVYQEYPNYPDRIIQASFKALGTLDIEMGSLDIVESDGDEFCIIDVNATTNFSPDNLDWLGLDPMQVMAEYIINKYKKLG